MRESSGYRDPDGRFPTDVGKTERAAYVLAGGLLLADGIARRGALGTAESVVGATLTAVGLAGRHSVARSVGGGRGDAATLPVRKMVLVQKGFTINRPADELYAFWRRLENLPSFMTHLESVTDLGEGRSRWVAKAPLGTSVEWEAEITDEDPGRYIAWRSVEGSTIANAGVVRFDPAPAGRGTEVRVSIEYAPPAGALGDTIAKLFGEAPEQQLDDDLRRFKNLVEAGEVPTTEGQSSGRRKDISDHSRSSRRELDRSVV